jgi:hypothetical protein
MDTTTKTKTKMDAETIGALTQSLSEIHASLDESEETLKRVSETLRHDQSLTEDERFEAREQFFSYLQDYERAYEKANDEYRASIQNLSDAYLEICPFYKGANLPKKTFLDSSQDVGELYVLFLMAGLCSLWEPNKGHGSEES